MFCLIYETEKKSFWFLVGVRLRSLIPSVLSLCSLSLSLSYFLSFVRDRRWKTGFLSVGDFWGGKILETMISSMFCGWNATTLPWFRWKMLFFQLCGGCNFKGAGCDGLRAGCGFLRVGCWFFRRGGNRDSVRSVFPHWLRRPSAASAPLLLRECLWNSHLFFISVIDIQSRIGFEFQWFIHFSYRFSLMNRQDMSIDFSLFPIDIYQCMCSKFHVTFHFSHSSPWTNVSYTWVDLFISLLLVTDRHQRSCNFRWKFRLCFSCFQMKIIQISWQNTMYFLVSCEIIPMMFRWQ